MSGHWWGYIEQGGVCIEEGVLDTQEGTLNSVVLTHTHCVMLVVFCMWRICHRNKGFVVDVFSFSS